MVVVSKFTKFSGSYMVKIVSKNNDSSLEVDYHVYEPLTSAAFYVYYYKIRYYDTLADVVNSTRTEFYAGQQPVTKSCNIAHPLLLQITRTKLEQSYDMF